MTTATLSPKQLEIRQRGSKILDSAFPMVREGGLAAVSMEAIAQAMKCTRGTIYNHFPNKEDVLLALATRAVQRRMHLFRYATTLGRDSRECCAAIGIAAEVYADLMPDEFSIEQITRHDPLWQKTSPERRESLRSSEHLCISGVGGVIDEAIQNGDLPVPRGTPKNELVERLVFGLWSLVYGGLVLEATGRTLSNRPLSSRAMADGALEDLDNDASAPIERMSISDPRSAIRRNCNALLDDAGWKPLFETRKYHAFVRRVRPKIIDHVEVVRSLPDVAFATWESGR